MNDNSATFGHPVVACVFRDGCRKFPACMNEARCCGRDAAGERVSDSDLAEYMANFGQGYFKGFPPSKLYLLLKELQERRAATDTSPANPFDRAAIAADPGSHRISMSFETLEQYEAALVFLDMADI